MIKHGKSLIKCNIAPFCFIARNEHKDMLSSFGLAEDSNIPTAAFVPAKIDSDSEVLDTKNYYIGHLVEMFCA